MKIDKKKLLSLILVLVIVLAAWWISNRGSNQPATADVTQPAQENTAQEATTPEAAEPQSADPETTEPETTEPETTEPETTTTETTATETTEPEITEPEHAEPEETALIDENGSYDSKEEVALYIHTYGHLPQNYITKSEAEKLGWTGGSLEPYAPGKSIGGSYFGNYEGLLPSKKGRSYTECDIDTMGARSRGAKRIVFSNDGLIYYTGDHYETFELLYGEVEE